MYHIVVRALSNFLLSFVTCAEWLSCSANQSYFVKFEALISVIIKSSIKHHSLLLTTVFKCVHVDR